jgi:mercuric reductase
VKTSGRDEIVTGGSNRTANPRIWAAGDLTHGPQFVYVAAAQGLAAANAPLEAARPVDSMRCPR